MVREVRPPMRLRGASAPMTSVPHRGDPAASSLESHAVELMAELDALQGTDRARAISIIQRALERRLDRPVAEPEAAFGPSAERFVAAAAVVEGWSRFKPTEAMKVSEWFARFRDEPDRYRSMIDGLRAIVPPLPNDPDDHERWSVAFRLVLTGLAGIPPGLIVFRTWTHVACEPLWRVLEVGPFGVHHSALSALRSNGFVPGWSDWISDSDRSCTDPDCRRRPPRLRRILGRLTCRPGRCVRCDGELDGLTTVGVCSACRVKRLPERLRAVLDA